MVAFGIPDWQIAVLDWIQIPDTMRDKEVGHLQSKVTGCEKWAILERMWQYCSPSDSLVKGIFWDWLLVNIQGTRSGGAGLMSYIGKGFSTKQVSKNLHDRWIGLGTSTSHTKTDDQIMLQIFASNIMLKKPCLKVQNLQPRFLDWKCPPHLLELFRKFNCFGRAARP